MSFFDWKTKTKKIGAKYNWSMRGLTLACVLLFFNAEKIFYFIYLLAIIIINIFIIKKYNLMGGGDQAALSWIISGLVIYSVYMPLIFFAIFCIISSIYFLLKKNTQQKTIGLPLLLLSFLITNSLYFFILPMI